MVLFDNLLFDPTVFDTGAGGESRVGAAAGSVPLFGLANGAAPGLGEMAGRLAFAARSPRAGVLLERNSRVGNVLNPARRGQVMEIA
ncbi:MAG: hypothetical protein ACK4TJ_11015 [Tabrizicola sp.]